MRADLPVSAMLARIGLYSARSRAASGFDLVMDPPPLLHTLRLACVAPLSCYSGDASQTSFYYVGHMSKYVPEGSVRVGWALSDVQPAAAGLETVSFVTPVPNQQLVRRKPAGSPAALLMARAGAVCACVYVCVWGGGVLWWLLRGFL